MTPAILSAVASVMAVMLLVWGVMSLWQVGPRGSGLWLIPALVPIPVLLLAPPGFIFFPLFFLISGAFFWTFGFPRILDARETLRIFLLTAIFFLIAFFFRYSL